MITMYGPRYKVAFRRRREGVTDYSHRLKLIKSGKTRAVVRRTNRYYQIQFVDFSESGDIVVASATSLELGRYGWKGAASNSAAAYLTGLLAARRAAKKGVSEAILDAGLVSPARNSGIYAALNGMVEGGLEIPHSDDILVPEERILSLMKGHGEIEEIKSKLVVK